jgi:hypothetical protein
MNLKNLSHMIQILPLFLVIHCNGKDGGRDVHEEGDMPDDAPEMDGSTDESEDPGGEDTGMEDPPDMDVDEEEAELSLVEEICMLQFDVICSYASNCCTAEERGMFLLLGIDCEHPFETSLFMDCVTSTQNSVDDGKSIINADRIDDCREGQIAALVDCPNIGLLEKTIYQTYLDYCDDVNPGTLGEDEFCWGTTECMPGLYCDMGMVYGFCRPLKALGEECAENEECGPDRVCVENMCAEMGSLDDPCDSDLDCGIGLWCEERVCTELLETGADCRTTPDACLGMCDRETNPPTCMDYCTGL